jgi:hypothetical protein
LPLFLVWALWAGLGYQALLDWVADRHDRSVESETDRQSARAPDGATRPPTAPARAWAKHLLGAGMLAAVLAGAWLTWPLADRSGDDSARRQGERLLAVAEENALVLGWWDTVPVLQYLQLVEGRRPDILAINRFLIPSETMDALLRYQLGRRPVYIDSLPGGLSDGLAVTQADLLLRLRPASDLPPTLRSPRSPRSTRSPRTPSPPSPPSSPSPSSSPSSPRQERP